MGSTISPTIVNLHHTTTVTHNHIVQPATKTHHLPLPVPNSGILPDSASEPLDETSTPPGLTSAFESGNWTWKQVYMSDLVVDISRIGHKLSRKAENGLAHLSYPSNVAHPAQAQLERTHVDDETRRKIRDILIARSAKRVAHRRELVREYKRKQRLWVHKHDEYERSQSESVRAKRQQFNVNLLLETRSRSRGNSGAANRDAAQVFIEMERAGGTAGGLDRWSKSITKVPEQNSNVIPVDGGILIDDPLREYYNARAVAPWSQPERLLFLEKYIAHGKDFRKIATFLPHKSIARCIQFYYGNKISLRLKTLGKGMPAKRRANSRHVLLELSKIVPIKRNIADNFRVAKRRHPDTSLPILAANKRFRRNDYFSSK